MQTEIAAGTVLRERYTVVKTIRVGGMGAVYQALDIKLANSLCAIKQMRPGSPAQEAYFRQRFEAEMRALVTLQHPGIPKVSDFFQEDSGNFLVMEYIDGESLDDELQAQRKLGRGPAAERQVVLDVLEVLEVLSWMHRQTPPLLHRDIKPANLIRERHSGRIRVVDFGLARAENPDSSGGETSVGTIGYGAPEQLMGRSETRSDLYAVGITMRELLTGLRPHQWTAQALNDISPPLAAIVLELCHWDVERRPTSAALVAELLRQWLDNPGSLEQSIVKSQSSNQENPPRLSPPTQLASPSGIVEDRTVVIVNPASRSWKKWLLVLVALLAMGGTFIATKQKSQADPGVVGPVFSPRGDLKQASVNLGEDIGLFRVSPAAGKTPLERAQIVASRMNSLYHHRCDGCGRWMLEPSGVMVGTYTSKQSKEVVLFYAHLHGNEYVYGPELLATVDETSARDLSSTPSFLAGHWRNILRDVVAVSRGEQSAQSPMGPSLEPLLQAAQQEVTSGKPSIQNLRAVVRKMQSRQAVILHDLFLKVPPELKIEPDQFPDRSGYSPLRS